MNVAEHFQWVCKARGLSPDAAQIAAVGRLQQSYEDWEAYEAIIANPLKRFVIHPATPQGIYMWGGVGRGKTLLMDCFYEVAPVKKKTRIHFHEFMHDVHGSLVDLQGEAEPLDALAQLLASRYHLICLDEFHVSDIADAMILYRLLLKLFEHHVQIITTSNYPPDDLYRDGLNRDRFLPAISLLKERLQVINVDGGIDYREHMMTRLKTYFSPIGDSTNAELERIFEALAEAPDDTSALKVDGREIKAHRRANDIGWFSFQSLCEGFYSQNDYLQLASRFKAIILSEVPQLTPQAGAAARRFVWLIDVLYDHNIKLIMSAAVPPSQLYEQGPLAEEFARTVSRIEEMQSESYLHSAKRLVNLAWA
ncbi:cell division protein ZapE [Dyella jiangningensis]|jgi:cell division protein ZapE|uniref:cell division protein ZapE n=1 Tax=Pseudomonadota TaxID=1224 RepID=UPI00088C3149|nr:MULTISPECIES: cell division protein ZapE [Pseudomonadota]PXV59703.1 cell division protein ZapE [Dyella sp. AtDHG13]SDJ26431.1 cell division protein ZapE [Dyella jiangningensis]